MDFLLRRPKKGLFRLGTQPSHLSYRNDYFHLLLLPFIFENPALKQSKHILKSDLLTT